MASGIELPAISFGAEPADGLMSLKPGAKNEAKFRKYVLPQVSVYLFIIYHDSYYFEDMSYLFLFKLES